MCGALVEIFPIRGSAMGISMVRECSLRGIYVVRPRVKERHANSRFPGGMTERKARTTAGEFRSLLVGGAVRLLKYNFRAKAI